MCKPLFWFVVFTISLDQGEEHHPPNPGPEASHNHKRGHHRRGSSGSMNEVFATGWDNPAINNHLSNERTKERRRSGVNFDPSTTGGQPMAGAAEKKRHHRRESNGSKHSLSSNGSSGGSMELQGGMGYRQRGPNRGKHNGTHSYDIAC